MGMLGDGPVSGLIKYGLSNRDVLEKQAARQLGFEINRDQEWAPFVNHWTREGRNAQDILLDLWLEQYAFVRRKNRGER